MVIVCLALLSVLAGSAAQADRIELVSRALPELVSGTGGAGSSLTASLHLRSIFSTDGRWSVFVSTAPNLVPGQVDANNADDVFLYDRVNGTVTLVSRADGAPGTAANGASGSPSISSDGRWIAFTSNASNLAAGGIVEGNSGDDVFLYDRDTGAVTLVSHASSSILVTGNNISFDPLVSANGNAVAFVSRATNLMTGQVDSGSNDDIFYWDRATGLSTLVSHIGTSTTTAATNLSSIPVLSADGSYVSYTSGATNLVSGGSDTNAKLDVFLWTRATNTNQIVSRSSTSAITTGNGSASGSRISADGGQVAFLSDGTNYVTGQVDSNGGSDVFLFSRATGQVTLVSRTSTSATTAGNSVVQEPPALSGDGNWVAFGSLGSNYVLGQIGSSAAGVYLWSRATNLTMLVSRRAGQPNTVASGTNGLNQPRISFDGSVVAYVGYYTNLITGQSEGNAAPDAFVFDRATLTNVLASGAEGSATLTANWTAKTPALSPDGRWTAFASQATNNIAGMVDTNSGDDVILFDRVPRTGTLMSRHAAGSPSATAGGDSLIPGFPTFNTTPAPVISADGRYVVFQSTATRLAPGVTDSNGVNDVFLHDRQTGEIQLVSRAYPIPATAPRKAGNMESRSPVISADGRWVAFLSFAPDLMDVHFDSSVREDVFLWDRVTDTMSLVSHSINGLTWGAGAKSVLLSADGSYAVFVSTANNIVPSQSDTTTSDDVFLYERATGAISLVSHTRTGPAFAGGGTEPSMSSNGQYVTFLSSSAVMVTGQTDTTSSPDVFQWERTTGAVTLVSHSTASLTAAVGGSSAPAMNADGEWVVFSSTTNAGNLYSGVTDSNGQPDLFIWVRSFNENRLLSRSSTNPNSTANNASQGAMVSADGRWVAFLSRASNLVFGQVNGNSGTDAFLVDQWTDQRFLASHTPASPTQEGNNTLRSVAISADGKRVSFLSAAGNLVPGQVDGCCSADLFVYDRTSGEVQMASYQDGAPATGLPQGVEGGFLSADGSALAFSTLDHRVVANDNNARQDTFVWIDESGTDLAIAKTNGVSSVTPGQTVTWMITATNSGPLPVSGATVTDTFPPAVQGVTWTCAAGGGASCAASGAGSLAQSVNLPVNGTVTFTVTGTVAATATGPLTNTASITPPGGVTDLNLANNSATDIDTLTPVADLTVSMTDSPDPVGRGATLTWLVSVTNAGPSAAATVTVTDILPAGTSFVGASGTDWICNSVSGTVTCTRASLAPGSAPALSIQATAPVARGIATLTNTVTVTSFTSDPVANNTTSTETAVPQPGITVAPVSGLTTTEAGGTAGFTVVLDTAPLADVTISLASSDTAEGTVDPASLTFTTGTWSTPQTVTVTGVDDDYDDGTVSYTITTGAAESPDAGYAGLDPEDVSASNEDDDTAGIAVTPTEGLLTTEQGGTATFTVSLAARPTQDVTIALESSDAGEGQPSPAALTFTTDDWDTPQTVTVTGQDDDFRDGDVAYTIVLQPAQSGDPAFAGIDPDDVALVNQDDSYEGVFYTVSQCLLIDTRVPGYGPALQSNQIAVVDVHGACGIPPTARAVALNVTFTGATSPGKALVFPGDLEEPPVDLFLPVHPAHPRSLGGIMPLGADGTLAFLPVLKAPHLNPTVHVVLYVIGYFE